MPGMMFSDGFLATEDYGICPSQEQFMSGFSGGQHDTLLLY